MMNTLKKSAAVVAVALFAGKATSNEVCKHVVIDGYFNELFMQNMDSRNSFPVFQEVDVNTGDWGAKHLVMSGTGYMYLYNSSSLVESETEWTMRFKDGSDRARVCNLDNWNRAYQGSGPVTEFNDNTWAMLSGADAASKCIPFPGTIDGEKIPVTSSYFYGVGDCAQAVSMQYPNATGVQVDPWRDSRAVWSTKCYAVFGHTKTDEPNDNKAHRACFFKDTVRPGGPYVNQFRVVDTKGKKINNIQECVDAGKADVSAQNAQATGIIFDSAIGGCWYSVASETSYYWQTTRKHVVFAKPLAKSASPIKCCIKKCATAA